MQKIIPFLWFDDNAEEAVNFYVSVFKNSKIVSVARYGEAGAEAAGRPKGTIMTIVFVLEGEEFVALNGGPVFTFSPAISLAVNCETQEEIDELSEKLSKGGEILECSWVRDKFGISWQIWPTTVLAMLQDKDHVRSERVMNAVLQMKKLDIRALEHAYQQE